MTTKPRKALKGLFTRTEQETKEEVMIEPTPAVVSPAVEVTLHVASENVTTQQSAPLSAAPEPVLPPVEETFTPPAPVVHIENVAPFVPPPTPQADFAASFTSALNKVSYNFDKHSPERQNWEKEQYLEFIRRLDAAQTEAFLLKGKLLEEVKRRFFEDNKTGWKRICEENLGLNYTTANQYIRVAQEFDVTSHQRTDFGFEHFKALLPLSPDERMTLLSSLPAVSVKALRNIVQEKLASKQSGSPGQPDAKGNSEAKLMVQLLQKLKIQIFDCAPQNFSQLQRWQLSAACRNLSEELFRLAESLHTEGQSSARTPQTSPGMAMGQSVEGSTPANLSHRFGGFAIEDNT
jgi:hypothetical protein